jgi:type IV pilus assembly protein PilA
MRKLRERIHTGQEGFTLIELLVVISIIGILAAIALSAFLGQRGKGQDSSAASDARNLVSSVESCYAQTQDYMDCDNASTDVVNSGLDIGAGPEQVSVTPVDKSSYSVTAVSEADSGGANHEFTITKTAGKFERPYTCTPVDEGGCAGGEW